MRPPEPPEAGPAERSAWKRLRRALLGKPKDVEDPRLFRPLTVAAFLAWVALGADGLSSSSYGPEAAFRNLGDHRSLALFLALATALTVFVLSSAYARIIEHYPFGGGGYMVASRLLGPRAGVVAGAALIIDYVLTCTTSVAAGGEAIFSSLPAHLHQWKLPFELAVIAGLTLLNLRGVRESTRTLMPIFLTFLVTHVILIGGSVGLHLNRAGDVARHVGQGLSHDLSAMGLFALALLFLRAYSLGAGTYTGIEAVSNGLSMMREPRVLTGKRTMAYMAISLALTAGGIIVAYLLMDVRPVHGKTMNYVLAGMLAGDFRAFGLPVGSWYVVVTIASEALLLFVAAQAGFVAGPRVMSNMAQDSYFPHRFAALSSRLTMQNGVLLMGGASVLMLLYTGGSVDALVVMYAINVFVTFALSQAGMIRYWRRRETRGRHPEWRGSMAIAIACLLLCLFILVVNVLEKFAEGAWLTVVVTLALVALCLLVRRHYDGVRARLRRLDEILTALPTGGKGAQLPLDPKKATAVMLVGGFSGLGIHALLTVMKLFPREFHNVVFMSVGVIDSATFSGIEEVDRVRDATQAALDRYVELAHGMGLPATSRMSMGTEAITEAERLAVQVARDFERAIFFAGKLIFERERWWDRLLHNETAHSIQRRLQFAGLPMVVLPVRVLE